MKSTLILATLGVLAVAASAAPLPGGPHSDTMPADRTHGTATSMPCASDELAHRHGDRDHRRDHARRDRSEEVSNRGMQVVPTSAGPGESGYGWRYFSDPAAHRAVVISPLGEYYYSRGKGPVLVAVTQSAS